MNLIAENKEQCRAEYVDLLERMVPNKKERERLLAAFLDGYDNGVRIERKRCTEQARLEALDR